MKPVAVVYIVLSVITIILFILTRRCDIRISRSDSMKISIGFTLFKLEFTKDEKEKQEQIKENSDSLTEGDFDISVKDIFSLIARMLGYIEKCTITVYSFIIPHKRDFKSFWQYFRYMRFFSVIFAYIDSKAEKLVIHDNAFILSSDNDKLEIDIGFGIILFDLIILGLRLLADIIKIGKKKEHVG